MSKFKFICFLILCSNFIACRKKELPTPVTPTATAPVTPIVTIITDSTVKYGSVRIKVNAMIGDSILKLGNAYSYLMPNGEKLSVDQYSFYLSNVCLVDSNNNRFFEANSYHLIMAERPSSMEFIISSVPARRYKAIELLIGVDSIQNVSGAQFGALDPKFGMFWSWSTGYIMAKLEGTSPQPLNPGIPVIYHIAGFKGEHNVLQKITIPINAIFAVDSAKTSTINLKSDINFWFPSPGFPGFKALPVITEEGLEALNISRNYSKMFSVSSVENP